MTDPRLARAAACVLGAVLAAWAGLLAGCGNDKKAPREQGAGQSQERPTVGVKPDEDAVAPVKYLQQVTGAMALAKRTVSSSNLHSIGLAVLAYSRKYGKLPASLDELVRDSDGLLTEQSILSPVQGVGKYAYIPGQTLGMDSSNIVAYDNVVYGDQCVALRLDGAVSSLSPADLDKAVAETHRRIAAAGPSR